MKTVPVPQTAKPNLPRQPSLPMFAGASSAPPKRQGIATGLLRPPAVEGEPVQSKCREPERRHGHCPIHARHGKAAAGLEDPFDVTTAIRHRREVSCQTARSIRQPWIGRRRLQCRREPRGALAHPGARACLAETQDFVVSITGYPAADWSCARNRRNAKFALDPKRPFQAACRRLPVKRHKLQQRYASAPWQPWGVHLAANWSLSRALGQYRQIQRKFPKVLKAP